MLKFLTQKPVELSGCTLLISGVSVGNVPALTCDQFIRHNQFTRVAYFNSRYIQPSVGYLPEDIEGGSLGLPIELYHKGATIILQFRSYCRFARKKDLVKEIVAEFKKHGVEEYILVSSLPHDMRSDLQIGSVENNVYFRSKGKISNLDLVQNVSTKLLSIDHIIEDKDLQDDLLKYGGLAYAFFKEVENITVLFIFSPDQENPKLVNYYERFLVKILNRKELQ